ncbi:uncharacterized protein LOC125376746 [Haliotis rufescens]|uniref:uncharacterized protein LOC125376746 n=1 Tax=Haliotis rufescens TaxID=6454 RepID=UPI00201F6BD3|nr:uncharacterized protein LOC125376746 [Haliotis rufescens]
MHLMNCFPKANFLDSYTDRYTYMRHHSRWLVAGSRDTKDRLPDFGEGLDNIAILSDPECSEDPDVGVKANSTSETTEGSVCLELSTLLRSPEGRVWSTVCYLDSGASRAVQGTVFPNIMFGYNQRQFLVTTKTVRMTY